MSEAATLRPRPKPRPRPVTIQSYGLCDPSASTTGPLTFDGIAIDNSDNQFVVNRGRTTETWRKLDEMNKITLRPVTDSDSDLSRTSTPLQKRAKSSATPQWRKSGGELRLLLTSSSSESDDDIEIIGVGAPRKNGDPLSPSERNHYKRKNERAKSRSLTPPPDIPPAVIASARNIVRQTFDEQHALLDSTYDDEFDDSTNTIVLDPELERIAEIVNSQPSIPDLSEDGNERVVFSVRWQKHPLNVADREPTWSYRMRVDESFRSLFEMVAEDAQVLTSAVVLSYNNKRIFPSTRPNSLGLCGEVQLTACHQKTYDYTHHQRHTFPTPSPIDEKHSCSLNDIITTLSENDAEDGNDVIIPSVNVTHSSRMSSDLLSRLPQGESDAESQSDDGRFKLILRSGKVAKDITLIVRPTTKCGSIVKTYIKKVGLTEQYPHVFEEAAAEDPAALGSKVRGQRRPGGRGRGRERDGGKSKTATASMPDLSRLSDPRIWVDGDKMDNNATIGEAGLDDGDMVDIVGL